MSFVVCEMSANEVLRIYRSISLKCPYYKLCKKVCKMSPT